MPRPKKNRSKPEFKFESFQLVSVSRPRLASLFGIDLLDTSAQVSVEKIIARTEHAIGRYMGMAKIAPSLPSNASLRVELEQWLKAGGLTIAEIERLHPWLQAKFHPLGITADADPTTADIQAAANDILVALKGSRRGRPENRAFKELIKSLRIIYRGHRRLTLDPKLAAEYEAKAALLPPLDPVDDSDAAIENAHQANIDRQNLIDELLASTDETARCQQGAMQAFSEAQNDEIEYISLALQAAGVSVPKNLQTYLLEVGVPASDRAQRLTTLAKKAAKSRI